MATLLGSAVIRIRPDTTGFEKEAKAGISDPLNRITQGAAIALGAVGVAGAGIFTAAIRESSAFEKQMSSVNAATRAGAGEMNVLKQAALDAGARTKYSAVEAAQGIEELAKSGVSTNDILRGGLNGALDLAASGNLSVGESAEVAASAMATFGLKGTDMTHVADLMAAGAGKARGEVSDLAQAFNQTALVANSTGLSIEETTGALAAFAQNGLIGSDAGTSFKTMLQSLTPSSKEAAEKMAELGISAYDANGEFIGLTEFAGNLRGAMQNLSPEARNAAMQVIFGSDAVRAANILYKEGPAGIQGWIDAVDDSGFAAEQAALQMDNLAGDWETLTGSISTALVTMGQSGTGPLRDITQHVTELINGFTALDTPIQEVAFGMAGVTGAVGLAGGAAVLAVPQFVEFYQSLGQLGENGKKAQSAIGSIGTFLTGPWGLAIAGATLALGYFVDRHLQAVARIDGFAKSMDTSTGAITENTRALVANELENAGVIQTAERLGLSLETLGDAAIGSAAAQREVNNALQGLKSTDGSGEYVRLADGSTIATDKIAALKGAVNGTSEEINAATEKADRLKGVIGGTGDEAAEAAGQTGLLTDATAGMGGAMQGVSPSMQNYITMLGLSEDEVGALSKSIEELSISLGEFIQPASTFNAMLDAKIAKEAEARGSTDQTATEGIEDWNRYTQAAKVSLDEYNNKLAEQVTAQENWRTNLLELSGQVSQGTIDELMRMGAEGAPLVQALADGSIEDIQRFDTLTQQSLSSATAGWAEKLTTATPVIRDIASRLGKGAADEAAAKLAAGTSSIEQIMRDYGVAIANGVNPVLTQLGAARIAGGRVGGAGGTTAYADGGFHENHVAQIAPAGAWRVWAEEETGGEAYIPLALSKRSKSTEIWKETGRRLGQPVDWFAGGGFYKQSDVPPVPNYRPFNGQIPSPAMKSSEIQRIYGLRIAKQYEDMMAATLMGGAFGSGGAATPNGVGGLGPAAAAARAFVIANFGIRNIGGYANRNIAGTGTKSDHALGKAIDVMIANYKSPAGIAQGNAVAQRFQSYPGVKYIIWKDQINSGSGWRSYGHPGGGRSDTLQHRDHVHVSFYDQGGLMKSGTAGVNLSGRAERVLDPRQTAAFERWMDSGSDDGSSIVAELRALRFEIAGSAGITQHIYNPTVEPASAAAQREAQRRALLT